MKYKVNTGLVAAKSSITLCSDAVAALLPVLGLKLAPAPELVASRSAVLNFDFNWMKRNFSIIKITILLMYYLHSSTSFCNALPS